MSETIDVHIHYGSPKDEKTGCYWSADFEKTAAYLAMLLVTKSLLKKATPERIQKVIFGAINKSKYVDKSVILALDEVYYENGDKHPEQTHMFVPNKYVAKLAAENSRMLFGASVHPYREDWEQALDYCIDQGAVLCKWIPSSQQINPSLHKCLPFFKKLAKHNLPLLCHAGPEYAIPTSNEDYNKYNNPSFLRNALNLGVTIIIAHCSLPYFGVLEDEYKDDYEDFYKLFDEAKTRSWKLYADLSAVATTFRRFYIDDIIKKIDPKYLLFASDYPIPTSVLSYNESKNIFRWFKYILKEVLAINNPLDKNFKLIKGMGFDDIIFKNAGFLFSKISR